MNKLDWPDLWNYLGMTKDNGNRWYPGDDTPASVREYLRDYREPSRAHPYSYAKALLTGKFYKYLVEHEPKIIVEIEGSTKNENGN